MNLPHQIVSLLSLLLTVEILADSPAVSYSQKSITPQSSAVPFDADLYKKDAEVISTHAEFLYWTVAEGALDYALKMKRAAWGPTPSYAQGTFELGSYNLDPGFRVALSYFRAPKYWEVRGQYTRLTATGSQSSGKPDPTNVYLTGTWPQIFSVPLASAESFLHLNYNVADLLIARVFNPNPHLRMKLIAGIVTAWINQDFRIRYYDSALQVTKIKSHWAFVGSGLRVGTNIDWFWGQDIYLTGMATTGVLMGQYKNHAFQKTTHRPNPSDNIAIPLRDAKYQDTRSIFTAQILLGPSWQKNYPLHRLEVFAGYELSTWLNLQEVYRSTASTGSLAKETWINTSALAVHGLTMRLTVDY